MLRVGIRSKLLSTENISTRLITSTGALCYHTTVSSFSSVNRITSRILQRRNLSRSTASLKSASFFLPLSKVVTALQTDTSCHLCTQSTPHHQESSHLVGRNTLIKQSFMNHQHQKIYPVWIAGSKVCRSSVPTLSVSTTKPTTSTTSAAVAAFSSLANPPKRRPRQHEQHRHQNLLVSSTVIGKGNFKTASHYRPEVLCTFSHNMRNTISDRSFSSLPTGSSNRYRRPNGIGTASVTTGGSSSLTPVLVVLTTAFLLTIQQSSPSSRKVCSAEKMSTNSWSRLFSSGSSMTASAAPVDTTDSNNLHNQQDESSNNNIYPDDYNSCPYYGCIMRPVDVHYHTNEQMTKAFETLRNEKRKKLVTSDAMRLLINQHIATSESVTLTLIGYKGGSMQDQINQDRSIIVTPYTINQPIGDNISSVNNENVNNKAFVHCDRTLLGVFDGHAPLGEKVSEYSSSSLPDMLAKKLYEKSQNGTKSTATSNENTQQQLAQKYDEIAITKEALEETFVEIDKTAPAAQSGGCTATVILKQGKYIYIANAGDSRSFIITYRPSTNTSNVIAISREDKPSLPDERERVEKMGGQVYIPIRGTSRVVYHDPITGAPTGLAMSRSIGDWDAGRLGVIPNPLIQVLNIDNIVKEQLFNDSKSVLQKTSPIPIAKQQEAVVDAAGNVVNTDATSINSLDNDDVYVFAVCASDGMMDYLPPGEIAQVLGHSLYAEDGAHPVAATEHLILSAASLWYHSKQGRYRDDIVIAVTTLRKPKPVSKL
jgi:serine/threonine protein phosphatase PrpC